MKAIIFGLDETLVDRTATVMNFLDEQYERFSDQLTCPKDTFIDSVMTHQKNGYADKLVAYKQACSEHGVLIAEDLFQDFKARYGSEAVCFPGVSSTLEKLSADYSLAIITNGRSSGQNKKIDSIGIRHFFASIKISEEEGIKKPNEEIYRLCLRDLGLPAPDCLFIGDNPAVDVITPKNMGMKAVWVRSIHYDEPDEADAVVGSIVELPNLIARMKRTQSGDNHNSGSSTTSS